MKLFKRKTASFQDCVNFIGIILFIWIAITRTALTGDIDNIFVLKNALILVSLGVFAEMLLVNLSIFITDFKNWRYDVGVEKKKYKGESQDEEKE